MNQSISLADQASQAALEELRGGRFDSAVSLARSAIAAEPRHSVAFTVLGATLNAQGKKDEARAAYRQAIDANNKNFYAVTALIDLHEKAGEFDQAQSVRQTCLQTSPDVNLNLGELNATGFDDPFALSGKAPKSPWYVASDVRWYPLQVSAKAPLPVLIDQFLLRDMPKMEPIFRNNSRLVTFGSCFAEHLRRELTRRGRISDNVRVPEGLNNSFALRDFFDWALTGGKVNEAYWYNGKAGAKAVRWTPEMEQEKFAHALKSADGFVVTYGLSEVWRDRETGGVFWRGIPADIYDPRKHEFAMSTVDENYRNMKTIYELLRSHCGDKPVVFTLSPVPLNATYQDAPCMQADCESKSILRAALGQLHREKLPGLHYWPSFEIVRWLGSHINRPMFIGLYDDQPSTAVADNTRHVAPDVVASIIEAFIGRYFAA